MYTDSHCHLDRLNFTDDCPDLDTAIRQANERGVVQFLCVSVRAENLSELQHIAEQHSGIALSVGDHPLEQSLSSELSTDQLIALAAAPNIVAIGETGLDYHYCKGDLRWQQERFRTHIQAAVATGLPLIVHTREAREDTLKILREEGAEKVGGVLHCFTESLEMAEAAMELGFSISFSGIITFKNASELRSVVQAIPMEKLLIETDSPYLSPVPFRGKPCFPAYVVEVAEKVAELKSLAISDVARITTENYQRLFLRNLG